MPNLFNTFSRAALVAIGLTLAPAAFAQGTFSSCPTGFTPIFTGVGTQNLEATCGVTCPTGQVTAVNGNTVSCTTGTPVDVAPSGCKITASPSSGSIATDVTLTLSCNAGTTLPINVAWQGTAPAGCPSGTGAMDALSKSCTVSSVAQTTTWTVSQFSNIMGNGSGNATKSATFTFNQNTGNEYANCPSGTLTSNSYYPVTNTGNTLSIGELYDGRWMVIKVVPSTSSTSVRKKNGFFGTSYSPDPSVQWSLSTKACDLSDANAVSFDGAKVKGSASSDLSFTYTYGPSGTTYNGYPISMIRGQPYYLNIYTTSGCPGGGSGCWYTNSSFE